MGWPVGRAIRQQEAAEPNAGEVPSEPCSVIALDRVDVRRAEGKRGGGVEWSLGVRVERVPNRPIHIDREGDSGRSVTGGPVRARVGGRCPPEPAERGIGTELGAAY